MTFATPFAMRACCTDRPHPHSALTRAELGKAWHVSSAKRGALLFCSGLFAAVTDQQIDRLRARKRAATGDRARAPAISGR
jgi:hypothetical protein